MCTSNKATCLGYDYCVVESVGFDDSKRKALMK